MAHVGVERLHPGDGQHHGAESKEGGSLVLGKEAQRPDGVERPSTSGCWKMLFRPSTARVMNQVSMMGANSLPTVAVPCFWMANSRVSTSTESGTI